MSWLRIEGADLLRDFSGGDVFIVTLPPEKWSQQY